MNHFVAVVNPHNLSLFWHNAIEELYGRFVANYHIQCYSQCCDLSGDMSISFLLSSSNFFLFQAELMFPVINSDMLNTSLGTEAFS